MDARKALFRAKLREQKQEKRVDSPLVRYNEYDQPVCRVCNVTLKSETLWIAHQASRKHHEAIQNLKAAAAKGSMGTTKADSSKDLIRQGSSSLVEDSFLKNESKIRENGMELPDAICLPIPNASFATEFWKLAFHYDGEKLFKGSGNLPAVKTESFPSSTTNRQTKRTLPEGFFDEEPSQSNSSFSQMREQAVSEGKRVKGVVPDGFFDSEKRSEVEPVDQISHSLKLSNSSQSKNSKGMLPEGFFDDKDADLRARGIQPIKVDIKDAYKEFEKEIQDDLQEVDDRLEEEEIDAAEERQEYESLEQIQYRERVDMIKKRLMEVKAAKMAKAQQQPIFMGQEESSDESSSDTEEEENFAVDWRAKHL